MYPAPPSRRSVRERRASRGGAGVSGARAAQVTLPLLAAGRNVLSFEAMPKNAQLVNASVHHNRAAGRPLAAVVAQPDSGFWPDDSRQVRG